MVKISKKRGMLSGHVAIYFLGNLFLLYFCYNYEISIQIFRIHTEWKGIGVLLQDGLLEKLTLCS